MSIMNFHKRIKFKSQSAVEYIFKKSTDFRIPVGFHSMDICLVGGGASGFGYPFIIQDYNNENTHDDLYLPYPYGGSGGYVRNLYNKDITTELIHIEIGEGGEYPTYEYPRNHKETYKTHKYIDRKRIDYMAFNYCIFNILGSGKKTYIKDISNNYIMYEALGGEGFFTFGVPYQNSNSIINYRHIDLVILSGGGANLGGGVSRPIDLRPHDRPIYDDNKYKDIIFTSPLTGCIEGNPFNIKPSYYQSYDYSFNDLYKYFIKYAGNGSYDEYKTFPILYACGNKAINLEGYGESRIFKDGKFLAGGGCVGFGDYMYRNYHLHPNQLSIQYVNRDGGGKSGIVKCISNKVPYSFELIEPSHDGEPNTGGGGAGGIYYAKAGNTAEGFTSRQTVNLCPAGKGGSGLCVIRFYKDDKRPPIYFIEGVNSFVVS